MQSVKPNEQQNYGLVQTKENCTGCSILYFP